MRTVTATPSTAEVVAASRRRRRYVQMLRSTLSHAVVILGGLFVIVPFYWMVMASFKTEWEAFAIPPTFIPTEWMWVNYHNALFSYVPFGQYFINTTIITGGVMAGRLLTASLVAFAFARMRFFGRNVLFILVLSTMMVPFQVTIIPLFIIYRELAWLDTYGPLIAPAWFGGGAFFIFLLRQFIMTVNHELDDAARIDGCGWFGIFLENNPSADHAGTRRGRHLLVPVDVERLLQPVDLPSQQRQVHVGGGLALLRQDQLADDCSGADRSHGRRDDYHDSAVAPVLLRPEVLYSRRCVLRS